MNYFITLETTSEEDYKKLFTLIHNYNLPINELGVTVWNSNIDNRSKMLNFHNKALSKHLKDVKKNNTF